MADQSFALSHREPNDNDGTTKSLGELRCNLGDELQACRFLHTYCKAKGELFDRALSLCKLLNVPLPFVAIEYVSVGFPLYNRPSFSTFLQRCWPILDFVFSSHAYK